MKDAAAVIAESNARIAAMMPKSPETPPAAPPPADSAQPPAAPATAPSPTSAPAATDPEPNPASQGKPAPENPLTLAELQAENTRLKELNKTLADTYQVQKAKWAESFQAATASLQSKLDRLKNGQSVEGEQPKPPETTPAAQEFDSLIAEVKGTWSEVYGEAAAEKMTRSLRSVPEAVARQEIQKLRSELVPLLDEVRSNIASTQRQKAETEHDLFHRQMTEAGHPDWAITLDTPAFSEFLETHPWRAALLPLVRPAPGQPGGTSTEISKLLKEFKESRPGAMAERKRQGEAEARQAAAAASDYGRPISAATPAGTLPDGKVLLSQLRAELKEAQGRPDKISAIGARMQAAMAEGRLVDDITNPHLYQGAPLP